MAITFFTVFASAWVNIPIPGPTSKIVSCWSNWAESTILLRACASIKKFWPINFEGFASCFASNSFIVFGDSKSMYGIIAYE